MSNEITMKTLCLGLLLFLGPHAARMMAEDWRRRQIDRFGLQRWKAAVSLLSLGGLALIVIGYGQARAEQSDLWLVPTGARHLAALLTLPALVLITAAYVPRSRLHSRLGHPMLLGTAIWAFAHLLANARPAELLLFGSFLAWSGSAFCAARRRDRRDHLQQAPALAGRDALSALIGLGLWIAVVFWLHPLWIGTRPLG